MHWWVLPWCWGSLKPWPCFLQVYFFAEANTLPRYRWCYIVHWFGDMACQHTPFPFPVKTDTFHSCSNVQIVLRCYLKCMAATEKKQIEHLGPICQHLTEITCVFISQRTKEGRTCSPILLGACCGRFPSHVPPWHCKRYATVVCCRATSTNGQRPCMHINSTLRPHQSRKVAVDAGCGWFRGESEKDWIWEWEGRGLERVEVVDLSSNGAHWDPMAAVHTGILSPFLSPDPPSEASRVYAS